MVVFFRVTHIVECRRVGPSVFCLFLGKEQVQLQLNCEGTNENQIARARLSPFRHWEPYLYCHTLLPLGSMSPAFLRWGQG